MSRAQLTSTVEQNTGGAVAPVVAGKNKFINGDFNIWQRNTSFTTDAVYAADRWVASLGTGQGVFSQLTTSLPSGFKSGVKIQRNASSTNTSFLTVAQALETVLSIPLQSQTLTFSFWAKKGAQFSDANGQAFIRMYSGTGTDQTGTSFGGWTGYSEWQNVSAVALTTSWVRYQVTGTVPSNATQVGVRVGYAPSGTAGADDAIYLTGIQLEVGPVATPFTTATGTLSGELQACQRYYYQLSASFASDPYTYFSGNGYAATTTIARAFIPLPVSMRTTPSLATNTLGMRQISNDTLYTSGTFSLAASYPWVGIVAYTHGSAVFTTGNACILTANNSTAAYVALSAEL